MLKRIAKIVGWLVCVALLISAVIVGISYRTLKKSLGRVRYSPVIQNVIRENRKRLKQEFKAADVSFVTQDGLKLQGYLVLRKGAKRNVLICHGYRSAKEILIDFAQMFPKSNILYFDFRAHGQSEGNLITLGYNEKNDVLAALNFLMTDERTRHLPVYGIGVSMGGVALLAAAVEKPLFKGLVIDSAFAHLEDQLAHAFYQRTGLPRYPFLPITRFLFELLTGIKVKNIHPLRDVRDLAIPVLFVHAQNDVEVPIESSYELYRVAQGKKALWIEGPCKHATICFEYRDQYIEQVKKLFAGLIR